MTETIGAPGGHGEGQRVLEADAAFGLARADERLGRRRAVRQDLEVDAGIVRTSRWRPRRRSPCGSCSGVQSSASRTVPSGACDADADGVVAVGDGERGRTDGDVVSRSGWRSGLPPGVVRRGRTRWR